MIYHRLEKLRSTLLFSANFMKKVLYSTVALGMLTGCAVFEKKDTDQESNWLMRQFEKDGNKQATLATVAYSHGEFKQALEHVMDSLKDNPRNQQALLVGALASEKLGRTNRARQYYEDLILINGDETTVLGSNNGMPEKISDIARKRLRLITIKQSELVVEDKNGSKIFKISQDAASAQNKAAISKAWKKKAAPQKRAAAAPAVGDLFTPQEQNIISRFLILKELAEKDLITKEEFLSRRSTNIGGLLPLTNTPPAAGVDNPVPSADLIIERINALKDAVESRAITPREFSAERDIIIEALLPPTPRTRMKPKAPSKDILGAAKDLRKLEVLYDLNLITSNEKAAEQKAVEKYLGINRAAPAAKTVPAARVELETQIEEVVTPRANAAINTVEKETTVETIDVPATGTTATTLPVPQPAPVNPAPQNLVPNVSSPF